MLFSIVGGVMVSSGRRARAPSEELCPPESEHTATGKLSTEIESASYF